MNDLEKAVVILARIQAVYPAVFRCFDLDKAMTHLLAHVTEANALANEVKSDGSEG